MGVFFILHDPQGLNECYPEQIAPPLRVFLLGGFMPSVEYFAGHFDGEGCITMMLRHKTSNRYKVWINV